ncbi:MAG: hypothetical protein JWM44_4388 [Bacilli bacterium]|nr:hypothetical protein [Bacilli bacterium]
MMCAFNLRRFFLKRKITFIILSIIIVLTGIIIFISTIQTQSDSMEKIVRDNIKMSINGAEQSNLPMIEYKFDNSTQRLVNFNDAITTNFVKVRLLELLNNDEKSQFCKLEKFTITANNVDTNISLLLKYKVLLGITKTMDIGMDVMRSVH